jgi:hypothetical protein
MNLDIILFCVSGLGYALVVLAIFLLFPSLQSYFFGFFRFLFPRSSGKVSHSYRSDPRNRALQSDLLILLKGDVATAKRLLLQQRRRNPGKPDNWYLEKVIYDLERDRH